MKYAFVLGREPGLSTAELVAAIKVADASFEARSALYSPAIMVAETQKPLDAAFFHSLGGSIKMAEVLGASDKNLENDLFNVLNGLGATSLDFGSACILWTRFPTRPIALGTRAQSAVAHAQEALERRRPLDPRRLERRTRADFGAGRQKPTDRKGRRDSALGRPGRDPHRAHDRRPSFERFFERDFGRPAADAKSGMLPPKLARMMVNLASASKNETLLDAFCGSGTILTEAATLGFAKLIGSDISERAVSDTQKNSDWIKAQRGLRFERYFFKAT